MFLDVKPAPCADVPGRLMKMIQDILNYSIRSFVREPEFEELLDQEDKEFPSLLKRKAVHEAIEKLFRLDYLERTRLCDLFEHDRSFERYLDDDTYQLREASGQDIAVLNELCNAIYDAANGGMPAKSGITFDGNLLKKQFAEVNGKLGRVCPVCVRELVFAAGEGETDHYFPRRQYPVLALHPYNLLPICSDCNSTRIKHMKSPLARQDRGPGELRKIFLPYLRPAKPEVEFAVSEDIERKIVMHPALGTGPYTQTRIDNLERLYRLGERWSVVLQNVYDDIREELAEQSGGDDTEEEWMQKLRTILRSNAESTRGRTEFVKGIYCQWLDTKTDQELMELFAECELAVSS